MDFSDSECRKDVKSAIKGYKVKGYRMISRSATDVFSAVSDPKIGVLVGAVGVLDTFFSYKVGLTVNSKKL